MTNIFSRFFIFLLALFFVSNFSIVIASKLNINDNNICGSNKSEQNCDDDCFFDRDLNFYEYFFSSKEIFYQYSVECNNYCSKNKIIDPKTNSPPKFILS